MKKRVIIFLLAAMIALSGCNASNQTVAIPDSQTPPTTVGKSTTEVSSTTQTEVFAAPSTDYSSDDVDSSFDVSSSTQIKFNNDSIQVSGKGAIVSQNVVTINNAGTYILSGTLKDGQVVVDTTNSSLVKLVLSGVNLSCSTSAPIYSKQADKTIITLADNTENVITDSINYVYAAGEDEPDAAIFSKDSLTINGNGSLTVNGNYKNAIGTKDDLVITAGKFTLNAANDALRGRDSISIAGGDFQITAGSDGLQSNNDTDATKGWISLDGGTYNITAANDAVQAQTSLKISDGNYNIITGGGNKSTVTATDTSDSFKGLKAGTSIDISGGIFQIDSLDDAVHTNADLTINNGTFTISTGDDGFHADGALIINSGKILINTSYEGLEGTTIDINGGDIRLTASDDGINAAGGNDSNVAPGGGMQARQQDTFNSSTSNAYIKFKEGFVVVNASGDGLDANGSIYVEGGTVIVNGPTNSGNGSLDYDKECLVSGGTFIAAGSSGMAQSPSTTSTQNSILVYYTSPQMAGTLLNLSDSKGNSIVTFAPLKDYQSVIISSPSLKQGETYTLYSGGTANSENNGGLYEGIYSAGTKKTDITISELVTRISEDGTAVTGQMGMGGGMGKGGGGRGVRGGIPPADMDPNATPPNGTPPEFDGTMDPNATPPEKTTTTNP